MTLGDAMAAISILAILLAILVPQFRSPDPSAADAAAADSLKMLHDRIELYRFRHDGRLPGDEGTEADFLADLQLTNDSIAAFGTANLADSPAADHEADDLVPRNPLNGSNRIHVGDAPPRDTESGWWYCPKSGELRPND